MTQAASFFLGQHDHLNGFSVKRSNMAFFHHLRRASKLILA
jgi:hypothetical protein